MIYVSDRWAIFARKCETKYLRQRAVLLSLVQSAIFFGPHFTTMITFIAALYLEDTRSFKASNVFTVFTFTGVLSFFMRMFQ